VVLPVPLLATTDTMGGIIAPLCIVVSGVAMLNIRGVQFVDRAISNRCTTMLNFQPSFDKDQDTGKQTAPVVMLRT
jgi:hypothetical protein